MGQNFLVVNFFGDALQTLGLISPPRTSNAFTSASATTAAAYTAGEAASASGPPTGSVLTAMEKAAVGKHINSLALATANATVSIEDRIRSFLLL